MNCLNITSSETSSVAVEEEVEGATADWHTAEWRQQKSHVFILSFAGKPIYTRYVVNKTLRNHTGKWMHIWCFSDRYCQSAYRFPSFIMCSLYKFSFCFIYSNTR